MKKSKKRKKTHTASEEIIKPKLIALSFWLKVAILLQFSLLAWQFYPAPSTNGDNAKYFILGTAMSELKGYKQIHLPNEPVETQYPVLFPMLLGFIQLFSDTPFLSKIIIAGLGVLVTLLFFYFGKSYLGYLLIPLLLLVASSSLISEYSVIIMSEVPYLLLTLLALFVYERSTNKPENRLLFFAAIALSVLPVHCRSIGLAFSVAFVIVSLFTKRYRYAVAHIVLLIGTIVLYRSLTSWDNPYMLQLFLKNSYDPEMGYVTLSEMVARIAGNIKKYSTFLIGNVFWPFLHSYSEIVKGTISTIFTIFVLLGWIRLLFTPLRIISIYILFYFGILSMWQIQWSSARFLVSVVPFLFLFLFIGLDTLIRSSTGSEKDNYLKKILHKITLPQINQLSQKRYVAVWTITLLLLGINIYHQISQAEVNKKQSADWRNFYSCADWVRLNTPEDAVIMSRKAELFYLRAKRKGIMYPFTHDVEKMIEVMKKENIKYVVYDNFFWTRTTTRYLFPVINYFPDKFKVVYALKNPDTFILEFLDK